MPKNNIDADYKAIVITLPDVLDAQSVPGIWREVEELGHDVVGAHRIVNAEHADKVDSAGLAVLIELLSEAIEEDAEFAILNPSENLRSMLNVYKVEGLLDGRVLDASHDGAEFKEDLKSIPNVIGCPAGEIRVYANGKLSVYRPSKEEGESAYEKTERKTRVGLTPEEYRRRSGNSDATNKSS